ncbi:MAG: NAD(P)H-hydrate dehydratase, partial [Steroidobacteraceae bacterium]
VVVLTGSTTVVAQPDGNACVLEGNLAALATSGSGDVLAGLMAGLVARGATPGEAALWSVYLHAQAGRALSGRLGTVGLLASELPAEIPALMHSMHAM